jgi:hypothetical protein
MRRRDIAPRGGGLALSLVLALLLQALLGLPLATRMALDRLESDAAARGAACCGEHEHHDPAPAPHHRDPQHCLVCQTVATPALVAPPPALPIRLAAATAPDPRAPVVPCRACRPHDSEARAPPRG